MSEPLEPEDDSIENIPLADAFAKIYERMLDLTPEHLDSPVSTTIDAWVDGTYQIKIYHHIVNDDRELLYYHSEDGVIKYGLIGDDELVEERVIAEPD